MKKIKWKKRIYSMKGIREDCEMSTTDMNESRKRGCVD